MENHEMQEKAAEGELALCEWLDKQGLAHVYLNQDRQTFARLFVGHVKRPDFLLVLEGVGMIALDAKNKARSGGVYTLDLDEELKKTIAFERIFRLPVWYVYKGNQKDVWYWISALKALEVGTIRKNRQEGTDFLAIKKEHFLKIKSNRDLGKLYTQRLPGLSRIKELSQASID